MFPSTSAQGEEITIRDLVHLIIELTGYQGEIRWDPTKPEGQPRRVLDTARAKDHFGFNATIGFEEGLSRTSGWYEIQRGSAQRSGVREVEPV